MSNNTSEDLNACVADTLFNFKKGAYYVGINVFRNLSSYFKTVYDNPMQFKST